MDIKKYIDSDPSLREVVDMKETAWINPYYLPFHLTDGPLQLVVSDEDIADAEARLQNVTGVFRLRHRVPTRHLLLVDDTFTTGATLSAAYYAVREAIGPAVKISIATLAAVQG